MEEEDEHFVPSCHRCAYFAEFGLDTNNRNESMRIVFLSRPERGLGAEPSSKQPSGWYVGVCCHPDTGNYRLISDMRTFGSPCGPMGALYEEKVS